MSDNNYSGHAITRASDNIDNVHYPRQKMVFGIDGMALDVSSDAPLPVDNFDLKNPVQWYAITPSGSPLPTEVRALWVNQPCDITLEDYLGTSVTFTVPEAGLVNLAPTKVTAVSTGTVVGLV